jgi:Ca-activated chloride channel family protein
VIDSPETPLLVAGEDAGRRMAVMGFDVHQSDLPLQPAFPVLMQHVLDFLVPPGSVVTPVVRLGDPASVVPLPEAQSVEVVTPDNQRLRLAPPFPAPPFGDTLVPGVYQVVQRDAAGQNTTSLFAANFVSPGESRLSAGDPVPAVVSGTTSSNVGGTPAAPRELWQWAALIGLVLLAAEWWAYLRQ